MIGRSFQTTARLLFAVDRDRGVTASAAGELPPYVCRLRVRIRLTRERDPCRMAIKAPVGQKKGARS
jgi:hypothetical protein